MAQGPGVERILGSLPAPLRKALAAVEPAAFLPPALAPLGGADAPLPFLGLAGEAALTPSRRAQALLLQLLDLQGGERVLVVGAESGLLGALCVEAGAREARLAEPDLTTLEAARAYLRGTPWEPTVSVAAGPPARAAADMPWDRILLLDPRRTLTQALGERLAEMGFALALRHTRAGHEVVKTLRSSGELAEIRAPQLPLQPGLPQGPASFLPPTLRASVGGVLALEEMAGNVWRGATATRVEEEVRLAVASTWGPPTRGAEAGTLALARRAFQLGLLYQTSGDLPNGRDLYARSEALHPSAEAATFQGWVCGFEGQPKEAIAHCERAIAHDPTLGNPYNDIGAYLLELGKPEEAIAWLERAMRATRYEAPFYPHLNLARARLALGDADAARGHLERALAINPGYGPAEDMLRRLGGAGR